MLSLGLRPQIMTALAALVCGGGFITPSVSLLAGVGAAGRGGLALQRCQPDPAQVRVATLTTESTDEEVFFVARGCAACEPGGHGLRCDDPSPGASQGSCRRLLRRAPKTSPPS